MFYLHTDSASAFKGCKTYSNITIIMYLPLSYAVVGYLDLKQEIFNALFCTPTKDSSVSYCLY